MQKEYFYNFEKWKKWLLLKKILKTFWKQQGKEHMPCKEFLKNIERNQIKWKMFIQNWKCFTSIEKSREGTYAGRYWETWKCHMKNVKKKYWKHFENIEKVGNKCTGKKFHLWMMFGIFWKIIHSFCMISSISAIHDFLHPSKKG